MVDARDDCRVTHKMIPTAFKNVAENHGNPKIINANMGMKIAYQSANKRPKTFPVSKNPLNQIENPITLAATTPQIQP